MQLRADESEGLDAPDDECHQNRDCRDGDVVIKLPDRLDVGPSIAAEHQDVVRGVDQRHAGHEEHRKNQNRTQRQSTRRFGSGDSQQADLGGRVEFQAEEHAKRYMCQLRRIMAKIGLKMRSRKPRFASSRSRS